MSSPDVPSSPSATTANSVPAPGPEPAKSQKRGIFEDMVVTGFGMATSAAVAYGSFYASKEFDFALYTWMANFIIPIGAIVCGFVAAVGYWAGSRMFHHRPTRLLLVNIVLVSLGTFFSIHHLDYSHASAGDRPLSEIMTFPDYLVTVTEHMTYRTSGSSSTAEPTELGMWGWGVAALQVIGFCIGGFLVYGMLTVVPYCGRCSKYFSAVWWRSMGWKDADQMMRSYDTSALQLQTGALQAASNDFAGLPSQSKFRMKGILSMMLHKCPTCENRRIKLLAKVKSGNSFTKLAEVIVPTEEPIVKPITTGAKAAK